MSNKLGRIPSNTFYSKKQFKHLPQDLDVSPMVETRKGSTPMHIKVAPMEEVQNVQSKTPSQSGMSMIEPIVVRKATMEEVYDLESEFDDRELVGLNLENIMEASRKRDFEVVPLDYLTKVHKFYLDTQEGKSARSSATIGITFYPHKTIKKILKLDKRHGKKPTKKILY